MNIAVFGLGAVGQPLGYVLKEAGHNVDYYDRKGQFITSHYGKKYFEVELVEIADLGQTVTKHKVNLSTKSHEITFNCYDLIIISVGYLNIPKVASVLKKKLNLSASLPPIQFLENYYEPEKLFLDEFPLYPDKSLIFGIPDIISYRTDKNYTKALYPFYFMLGDKGIASNLNNLHFVYQENVKTAFLQRLCSHNTAHNMLAYLGNSKGYHYISEAIADREIKEKMVAALREGAEGLVYKYGISMEAQMQKIEEEVNKLFVGNFNDPIARVARTPIKKLTPFERFTLPAKLAYEAGVFPETLCEGMAYLLKYNDPNDNECITLAQKVESDGVEETLFVYTGLELQHPIVKRVKEIYLSISEENI